MAPPQATSNHITLEKKKKRKESGVIAVGITLYLMGAKIMVVPQGFEHTRFTIRFNFPGFFPGKCGHQA